MFYIEYSSAINLSLLVHFSIFLCVKRVALELMSVTAYLAVTMQDIFQILPLGRKYYPVILSHPPGAQLCLTWGLNN
jgi:hypothetical protein